MEAELIVLGAPAERPEPVAAQTRCEALDLSGASGEAWLEGELAQIGPCTYPGFLRRRAAGRGDGVALVFGERHTTHADLHRAIDRAAGYLAASLGVRPGDRVVLNLENSDAYVVAYFAVLRAGAVAVPINPKLTPREIAYVLSDSTPVLYIDAVGAIARTEAGAVVPSVAVERLLADADPGALPPPAVDPDEPAAIFYTSGTTGRPKGVVHSHATLVAGAHQSAKAWGYDRPGLVTLAMTPLFHIAAHAWFFPALAHGGTLVIDTFRTERAFQLIERHRVASMGAVPSMLLMMVAHEARGRYDLGSVVNLRFGASPMPPERLREVQAMFPNAELFHGMGQTESGGTISVLPPSLAFIKAGGTGYPLPACRMRIVDENDRDVPQGTVGEVVAQGPQVMHSYFGREQETEATLQGGWLHTGDLGYLDPDGCVYLVDRKKDMIIRGGENIYSVEIENAVCEHPAVQACAVVGAPDDVFGEQVHAFVVLHGKPVDGLAEELRSRCRAVLAAFKIPQVIEFVDDLPRTATGKVQKAGLRASVGLRGAVTPG